MSRNAGKNDIFKGVDITIIVVVSIVALGSLAFGGTLIWLLSTI